MCDICQVIPFAGPNSYNRTHTVVCTEAWAPPLSVPCSLSVWLETHLFGWINSKSRAGCIGRKPPCNFFLQDAPAVLFCCEDRAIICRECDLMIHTANEFTAKHSRHILFQVAAGLKALPPPGPGRPDSSSQIASDTASAATHMDKAGFSPLLSCCLPKSTDCVDCTQTRQAWLALSSSCTRSGYIRLHLQVPISNVERHLASFCLS